MDLGAGLAAGAAAWPVPDGTAIWPGEKHAMQAADVPTSILHGWHDELIPAQQVVDWAQARNARLLLVDDSHRLSDHVDASADAFAAFLQAL